MGNRMNEYRETEEERNNSEWEEKALLYQEQRRKWEQLEKEFSQSVKQMKEKNEDMMIACKGMPDIEEMLIKREESLLHMQKAEHDMFSDYAEELTLLENELGRQMENTEWD